MGCDIHGWVEVKVGNKYVAVAELKDRSRNYGRFSLLASVRGISSRKPIGIPDDVSDTAKYHIDYHGVDGHSHSYLSLSEAAQVFLKTSDNPSDYDKEYPASSFFDYEEEDITKARLVFWFDN